MENSTSSLNDTLVSPIQTYGPIIIILLIGAALLWLSFSAKGRKLVDGMFDIGVVLILLSSLWLAFLWLIYAVFFSTYTLFS